MIVEIGTWLLLLVMCAPAALCQDTDSSEDEPVTAHYIFNRDRNFASNATGSLSSGEEAVYRTQQVFGAETRFLFDKFESNDEYMATCGDMSTSEKTVWQNSEYPKKENLPSFCDLKLLPPAGTCALKIHFNDLNLIPDDECDNYYWGEDVCNPACPFFKAYTPDDITPAYCLKLDAYEGILPVSDTTEPITLLLQLNSSASFRFKITVTAVNCNDIKTYESPSDCGIKNQDPPSGRADIFGDLGFEHNQDLEVSEYGDHVPEENRQSRRTSNGGSSENPGQKNKNDNKNKNGDNKEKIDRKNKQKDKHHKVALFQKEIAKLDEGKKSASNKTRVKGKETVHINEWPWIVLIKKRAAWGWSDEFCNGVLLDNSKVLTSRYCVYEYYDQPFGVEAMSVRIGEHDFDDTSDTKIKIVGVSKVTIMLMNVILGQNNAFAILHLKEEVQLSDTIRPICLPVSYNRFDGSGVVTGWEIDWGDIDDPLPKEAEVTVLDKTSCEKAIDRYWYYFPEELDKADVVCAKNSKSRWGAVCYGDYGNTLTQMDQRGAYYVTGVATNDIQSCYSSKVPTVFSKIESNDHLLNVALN